MKEIFSKECTVSGKVAPLREQKVSIRRVTISKLYLSIYMFFLSLSLHY